MMTSPILQAAAIAATAPPVSQSDLPIEELVVFGRAQQQIGTVHAASAGLVGYDDINLPPMLRVGELVESVPGMVATQHSGTGKANQYFLRGFNLDHGTDFSVTLDGVPINMRTHAHGQGYLDLNFMIPELVATTNYRKGPYRASVGDFSSAGSVDFQTYERLNESLAQAALGENGYVRGLLAGSTDLGPGNLTTAIDATFYDGPWDLPENLQQYKFYASYAFDVGSARAQVGLQGYQGSWDATDQIPLRAVQSGLIDSLGYIDPDLGGDTSRYALTALIENDNWWFNAYYINYELSLWSNFTYHLDQPIIGDEFEQHDDRSIWGARLNGSFETRAWGKQLTWDWGTDVRYDDIGQVALYGTVEREPVDVRRQDAVTELSIGAFLELELQMTEKLRGIFGMRADYYDWDVDALREPNSGSGHDALLSPKLSTAYRFAPSLEGYLSWGLGFHSNDVRGATISVDPGTGAAVDPVDTLVGTQGAELGLRFERGGEFNATLAAFWLELDSELVYVGDAGTTEPQGASVRQGIETTAFWELTDWLTAHAEYTYTHARFKTDDGEGRRITGAVESTFVIGANAVFASGFNGSLRLRYLGPAPLTQDNSVRSEDSFVVNGGIGYRRGPVQLRLDVFNLLDSDAYDISYYYASRLEGEPLEGVEDLNFHPLEPRSVRGSVTVYW